MDKNYDPKDDHVQTVNMAQCKENTVSLTGPVCSRNPVSMVPVRGLKELLHTGGFSIRERKELPS